MPGPIESAGGIKEPTEVVVGQYADYLDTGIWSWDQKTGKLIPPSDLTPEQARDFQLVFGELFEGKPIDARTD
jgi:hypothetical protein